VLSNVSGSATSDEVEAVRTGALAEDGLPQYGQYATSPNHASPQEPQCALARRNLACGSTWAATGVPARVRVGAPGDGAVGSRRGIWMFIV
jgi:hypothetical protein